MSVSLRETRQNLVILRPVLDPSDDRVFLVGAEVQILMDLMAVRTAVGKTGVAVTLGPIRKQGRGEV